MAQDKNNAYVASMSKMIPTRAIYSIHSKLMTAYEILVKRQDESMIEVLALYDGFDDDGLAGVPAR